MKTKKFLVVGTMAALVIGLAAVSLSAQDRDADCGRALDQIVRQTIDTQVKLAAVEAQVRVAQAISDRISNAVTGEVTARVNARIDAALAHSLKLQERAGELARQTAPSARQRITINGDEFGSLEDTGWLGVTPEDVSADRAKELKLSSPRGVYLSEVEKDSPAEKAGLKSGDVITEFNGQHVEGVAQFRRLIRETPAGRTISITLWRDGQSKTVSVTLGNYMDQVQNQWSGPLRELMPNMTLNNVPDHQMVVPWPPEARTFTFNMPDEGRGFGEGWGIGNGGNNVFRMSPTPTLGISAESLSGQLGTYFGAPDGEGVLIREVNSGSPAEKGGLKAGDVITKIDGDRVRTVNEMQSKLREKREAKTVQVTVMRKGSETTVTVEPNKPQTRPPAAPRVNGRSVSF
jgi:serine protease Do